MRARKTFRLGFGRALLFALATLCLAPPAHVFAWPQKDPLTDQQIDQLRENGDQPIEKIKLYLGFIEERTAEIRRLSTASDVQNQEARMRNLYEEFTRISDELEDNLDSFAQQHADLRKVLKTVVEQSGKWPAVLNGPKLSREDDFARKTALSAVESVHDDAQHMLEEQERYFSQHKTGKSAD